MKIKVTNAKEFQGVKTGTHLQFHDKKLWLIDQHTSEIVTMNKNWREPTTISLFQTHRVPSQGKFFLNKIQPGLTANTIVFYNSIPRLLVVGNGNNDPFSKYGVLFNLDSLYKDDLDLTAFYSQIERAGIKEPNLVAAASFPDEQIVFAHQTLNTPDVPQLIIVKNKFWKKPAATAVSVLSFEFPNSPTAPFFLNDFAYSFENDWLLFTGHTQQEHSINYLGIIENASRKIGRKHMKVNELIVLNKHIEDFEKCKVESVCIQSEKINQLKVQLLSHHENGYTTLYKLRIKDSQ